MKIGGPLLDIDSPDVDDSHAAKPHTPPAQEQPKAAEAHKPEKHTPSHSGKVIKSTLWAINAQCALLSFNRRFSLDNYLN